MRTAGKEGIRLKEQQTDLNDVGFYEFDTVNAVAVYLGGFTDLKKINDKLVWNNDKKAAEMFGLTEAKHLTLKEIYEQIKKIFGAEHNGRTLTPVITVITDGPLEGTIYTCNNHGEGIWEKTGTTRGYA